ncbi:hypothetical protein, partial [Mycobacteroides abscessus]|uniref:hypothetical protein n=1 Tax=Mycobacteroides abscessus TaxID=36809 RepID=UPI001F3F9640
RANAGLDRIPDSVMIILGKVRPLSGRLLGPHPQVLIIARVTGWMGHVDASIHTAAFKEKD